MHRRLVFEEPVSRAALWSRRLAWFALAVLVLALLVFRSGEPTLEGLAPVAAAYGADPGTVYLIRPDLHVAGRWRAAVAGEILATLDTGLGRPS